MAGYWGGSAEMQDLARRIQAQEFDHPFILDGSVIAGNIRDAAGYHGPESVETDDDADILIDGVPWRDSVWRPITGATQQYAYNGAVMHSSEFIGGGIAELMSELAEDEPQVFVMCVVKAGQDGEDDGEDDAGWCILYRTAEGERCAF